MASISADDPEIDQAVAELYASKPDGEKAVKEAARNLLEVVAHHDAPTREETIELLKSETEYGKSTIRDWFAEVTAEVTQQKIEVVRVLKKFPADPSDDVIYEFDIICEGTQYDVAMPSDAIQTERVFQKKILERTDTLIEFENWRDTINEWLDQAEIIEVMQEPTTAEHAVVEGILENIATMTCYATDQRMRELGTSYAYYDDAPDIDDRDDPVVWISGTMIDDVSKRTTGDIDHTRTRAILGPYLAHEYNSVRTFDGGFRAWAFDYESLRDEELVDAEEQIAERTDEATDDDDDESQSQDDTDESDDDGE